MIQYMSGDLFQSGAECLVNTVNCEGYMGKGIAYQFKLQFPENNRSYVKVCRDKTLTVGRLHVFRENGVLSLISRQRINGANLPKWNISKTV